MKKKLFNRALSGIMTAIIGFSVIPASKPITAKAAPLSENGTHKGLDWELWQENDTSNVEMKSTIMVDLLSTGAIMRCSMPVQVKYGSQIILN